MGIIMFMVSLGLIHDADLGNSNNKNYYKSCVLASKFFELVIYIRFLKILTYLYEVKSLRVIIITIKHLLGPLAGLVAVQSTILYLFATIGMFFFGGELRPDSPVILYDATIPPYYYLMNFNDLACSWVTLFTLIIVNNWMVIVQMYVDVTQTLWTRLYFLLFYYFGVVIGINIVIAFALDMFSAVERMDAEYDENKRRMF